MALSGTFGTNYGAYLRIQGDWSATQDKAANTSTVTLRTYWIDRGSSTGISSSSSKSGSSTIEGTSSSFSATAGLYPNQKKLIHTQVRTITHNSDGSFPGLDLAVSFSPAITFSGTYYGTVSASDSFSLNTIPRESSIASDCSWTAGYNETISISRGSTSFNHLTQIYVKNRAGTYIHIKNVESPAAEMYTSSDFSVANHTEIFNLLDGRNSADTRFVLHTYSGSTKIGESTHYGTVTIPSRITAASGYDAYWYTDEAIEVPLTESHPDFTWVVRFKLGSYTKTVSGSGPTVAWNPSTTEEASLHAQMPNDSSMTADLEIDTFYNGEQVDTTSSRFFVFIVRDANPSFSGTVTYRDSNASTSTITGNNQFIVQGRSILEVTLSASSATAQKGASLVEYVFTVAGVSETRAYTTSSLTIDFGTISASTNQTITVEAVDSRGNRSEVSKIINVVPYSLPTLSASALRVNGFEATTMLNTSGSFAPLKVAGVDKNYMTSLRYRTRKKYGAWSGYTTISRTTSGTSFTGAERTLSFPIEDTYEIEVDAVDRIGTKTVMRTVGSGRPIFFIDDMMNSIALNGFPSFANSFEMFGTNLRGVNNIYLNSSASQIYFPKTTSGSDLFEIRDRMLRLNGANFFELDISGNVKFTKNKANNGYNRLTARDSASHDDEMLIQATTAVVTVSSNNGYVDVSFPTSFSSTPEWILATAKNASSSTANVAVYNHSASGCRIWLQRIGSTAVTYTVDVEVVACGRKA